MGKTTITRAASSPAKSRRGASPAASPASLTADFSLTRALEHDYVLRGVFPALRRPPEAAHLASASCPLTAQEAQEVLVDARAQVETAKSYRRNVYRAAVTGLEWAIKRVTAKQALLSATAAVCDHESEHWEMWKGTKEQLQAKGIKLEGPWPGETGGRRRWAKAVDWRGHAANVSPLSKLPGRYEVGISIPVKPRRAADDSKAMARRARSSLEKMPADAEAYRSHLIEQLRYWTRILALEPALKPATWHGYQLSEHAVSEIQASFDTVVEAIAGAEVLFDASLHAQIAQEHRAVIAANDDGFQASFANLVRPRPELLEGSAS